MKSLAMNKLFSKSYADFPKINSDILMLLTEQRLQRNDLKIITKMLDKILNVVSLQKQVDDFYESEPDGTSNNNPTE